jgi:diguanylate cyclase (GGDEF)-like protein
MITSRCQRVSRQADQPMVSRAATRPAVQDRAAPVEDAGVPLVELAARVLGVALGGAPEEADRRLEQGLRRLGPEEAETPSHGLAALMYAVAGIAFVRGDWGAQVLATDRLLWIARSIDSPGWASNALSLRALARLREGAVELATADLAVAEIELAECADDGLRCWAHTGLGYCYDLMRLYELAQPHYLAAQANGASPMPLLEAPIIDLRNLTELHLRWAEELERVVPVAASVADVEALRREGRRWAAETLLAAEVLQLPDTVEAGRRLDLCARAAIEPAHVLPGLEAALAPTAPELPPGERAQLATALARALYALGRGPEAVAAARLAVESATGPIDWQVRASAHHLLVELEAEAGTPGAMDGRAYAQLLSNVLWQQRLRTLQGTRTALEIEHLKRTSEIATRAAREDPLTGLGNRRALDEALVLLLQRPSGEAQQHCLMLLDIDGFKSVNDTHGHPIGDQVLCGVAAAMRGATRSDDLLVRLGGDEFVVLAADTTLAQGEERAARIHRAVERTDWDSVTPGLRVHTSIGVGATDGTTPVTALFDVADALMYADKRRKRLRVAGSAPAS